MLLLLGLAFHASFGLGARSAWADEGPTPVTTPPATTEAGTPTLELVDRAGVWDLGTYAELLVDPTDALTLDEVREQAGWRAVGAPRTTLGLGKGVMWLRVAVADASQRSSDAPSTWRVEFAHPRPVELESYVPDESGTIVHKRGGLVLARDEREVVARSVVVPFVLPRGRESTLYFRIRSSPLGFSAIVGAPEACATRSAREEWIYGIYYGIALGLWAYNLFLLVALRDRTYGWYLLTLASTVAFFLSRNGYLFEWGWHANSSLGGGGLVAVQLIGILNFTRTLLSTGHTLPRLDRWLGRAVVVLVLSCIASLALPQTFDERRIAVVGPPVVIGSVVIGLVRWRQGSALAVYFTVAWGLFLSGACLYVLKSTGLIPHNAFTEHAMQVGSGAEMVLLALALAHRVRTIESDARNRAHALALERIENARGLEKLRAESAARIVEAHDEHSRALARDLHDSVGHRFLLIDRAAADAAKGEDPEALEAIAALAREGLAETREIAHGLYPQRLLDLGLCGALHSALDGAARAGLAVESDLDSEAAERLSAARRLTALRIAEEALQNAMRHARARTLHVRLTRAGERATLEIRDDGRGIAEGAREGLGTRTMRDRAAQAGGTLEVAPNPLGGTRVLLTMPLGDEPAGSNG